MADQARYRPNRSEMRKLMQSREIADAMKSAAENAQQHAESVAPRETGRYAASFRVETRIVGDRQTAVLVNRAKYATVLEVRHRVLGRSADQARP